MTLGSFLVFFCYVWGHKAMQLVLGRLAFRHEIRWCIAVADASHKAMQLVLGRLAGHKTEKFQFYSRVGFRSDVWGSFATFWA